MVVVFTGGRDFTNVAKFERIMQLLESVHWLGEFFVGDCPTGLDLMVRERHPSAKVFKADWVKFKRQAGPLRNRAMIDHAAKVAGGADQVLLVAFPTGGPGTRDCTMYAKFKGVTILEVR